jgi:hypothetical protein
MTVINAVTSPSIRHSEFVRLTLGKPGFQTVYTFCNAAAPITVSGITFSNLGALLNVGDVQRDMKATSDDMTIALTGIDAANIVVILSNEIKGSLVEVWRGFFDANNQIITTPTLQFFKRYQGIVNNVGITEDFNTEARQRIATCSISCSSMRRILENRISGVKTNENSWKFLYGNDTSMDRVAEISATYFDFGKAPKTQTVSTDPTTTIGTNPEVPPNSSEYYGGGD